MPFDLLTHLYKIRRYLVCVGHWPFSIDLTDKLHQILPWHLDITWLVTYVSNLQNEFLVNVSLVTVNVGQITVSTTVVSQSVAWFMSITASRSKQFKLWFPWSSQMNSVRIAENIKRHIQSPITFQWNVPNFGSSLQSSKVQNEIHITFCKGSIVLAAFIVYPIINFPYKHGCRIHFELLNFVTNFQVQNKVRNTSVKS